MPIYEYYCTRCHGRFQHLAKRIGEAAPPCPRCGNLDVSRQVSAAATLHTQPHHTAELREASRKVDQDDSQAIARFLQESGHLADADGVYGSNAYRELLARRAEGATEADVADLTPSLLTEMQSNDAAQMAGAVMFSKQVENRMGAEGPPERHDHDAQESQSAEKAARVRRRADNLGWA